MADNGNEEGNTEEEENIDDNTNTVGDTVSTGAPGSESATIAATLLNKLRNQDPIQSDEKDKAAVNNVLPTGGSGNVPDGNDIITGDEIVAIGEKISQSSPIVGFWNNFVTNHPGDEAEFCKL